MAVAAPTAPSATAPPPETLLVALRLNDLTLSDGLDASLVDGRLCLDLPAFLAAVDFPIRASDDGLRYAGWFLSEDRHFTLDLAARVATVEGAPQPTGPLVHLESGAPCAQLAALEAWFPLHLTYDAGDAVVRLSSTEPLPVEQRLQRELVYARVESRKRALAQRPPLQDPPYKLARWPAIDVAADAAYRRDGADDAPRFTRQYRANLAGELLYLSTEALAQSDTRGALATLRLRAYRRDPDRNLLGPLHVSEAGFGDVTLPSSELVGTAASGRGFSLSTFPVTAPDEVDRTTLQGDLPDGWDAELYRNNVLIDVQTDRSDRRFDFARVPVLLGENRFRVVLRGPQGEERMIDRVIVAGYDTLPRGALDWRLGVVQDGVDLVALQPTRDIRTRPEPRLEAAALLGLGEGRALGIGLSSLANPQGRSWYVQPSLHGAIGRTPVSARLSIADNGALAAQLLASRNFGAANLNLRYLERAGDYVSPRIADDLRRRVTIDATGVISARKGAWQAPLTMQLGWERTRNGDNLVTLAQQTGLALGRQYLFHELDLQWRNGETQARAGLGLNARLGALALRGQLRYRLAPAARLDALQLTADHYPKGAGDRQWLLRTGLQYYFGTRSGEGSVFLGRQFRRYRLGVSAGSTFAGAARVGLSLGLSLGHDGAGWRLSGQPLAQTGRIAPRVFEDANGNSRYDDGEPLLDGADVLVNRQFATDRRVSANLAPFEPARVSVDLNSIDNPDLAPLIPEIDVRPRPGITMPVLLPLAAVGQVDGVVRRAGPRGPVPVSGIALRLERPDGSTLARATSAYDGFISFDQIPVGDYRLAVDAATGGAPDWRLVTPPSVSITSRSPYVSNLALVVANASDVPTASAASGTPRLMLPKAYDDEIAAGPFRQWRTDPHARTVVKPSIAKSRLKARHWSRRHFHWHHRSRHRHVERQQKVDI